MWKEIIVACSEIIFRSSPWESKEGATGKLTRIDVNPLPPNYEEAVPHTLERFFLELLSRCPVPNFTQNFIITHLTPNFHILIKLKKSNRIAFQSVYQSICIAHNFQDCEGTLLPVSPCVPQFSRFMESSLSPCASVFLLTIFRFLYGQSRIK
jgi:hypothetical protein